ncbi:DUF5916 domain-containing protein [Carboxylicivirga caseinilyticus]|uniref:carbohydrate binding family 9 domain-containing protein n=1 Tax=Carboxylicivirga caseinilyticus TaxID=3417572 RepID=UPI003D342BC9|nr:carbohydrate binding family 9 domain-containing protein [Marinilabiliaceae bacterium A049]
MIEKKFIKYIVVGLLVFLLVNKEAYANAIAISTSLEKIELTATISDEIWQKATPIDLTMHKPIFGKEPSEKSDVRLLYTQDYLWVFARLYYKNPDNIVANSKKRDEESKSSDAFGIILDTYNDNESALAFFTSPTGQRIDYAMANDGNYSVGTTGTVNYNWNTFWDVKSKVEGNCWYVTMRIPFSSLRFQSIGDKTEMGLIVNRTISYCNEINTYPAIDPQYGIYAAIKPSQATTVSLENVEPSKPLLISPYALTGLTQIHELNETGTKYDLNKTSNLTGGLDVKYNINSNLTLDLTVNTDFAQAEADDELVNITRYSLYLADKRQFFQERSSIFQFSLGGSQQLFYSRRIGLANGQPVTIYGGGRLTGRIGKWDVGILNMQTEAFESTPSENFGVYRLRRQVLNPNSYVGAMATTRLGVDGSKGMAYGVDAVIKLFGDDYLEARVAQNTDADGTAMLANNDLSFATVKWERRRDAGFAYNLNYTYSGTQFSPSVGFVSKLGVEGTYLKTQYGWIFGENSPLYNFKLLVTGTYNEFVTTKELESAYWYPGFSLMTKSGWSLSSYLFNKFEGFDFDFYLSQDAYVPAGNYQFLSSFNVLSSPISKPVSCGLIATAGGYYDGGQLSLSISPVFNLSSSLQLTTSYSLNKLTFNTREQEFVSHLAKFKALVMLNTKLSISSFVQYNSVSHAISGNFRFRYNPAEGKDLYIVYNESRPDKTYDFHQVEPISFFNRMLMVKYVHTFKI